MMEKWDELQLEFDLDLDDIEADANERAISYQEARQISEAAYTQLRIVVASKSQRQTEWFQDFISLQEKGWPWRVAAYIAWASSPKLYRWPETLGDLAVNILGLTSPRVIYTWRKKHPTIDVVVGMMQSAPLWQHRRDAFEALAAVASMHDYKGHQDRALLFKMTGDFIDKSQIDIGKAGKGNDLSEKSEAELRKWLRETLGESDDVGDNDATSQGE